MAEGAVLKWLSDYRINIERDAKRRERDNTETKEAILPSGDTLYSHFTGLWVIKALVAL